MKAFNLYFLLFMLAVSAGVIASCTDIPNLSNSPEISLKSAFFRQAGATSFTDTIFFQLEVKDGNGDLGLAASDNSGRFALRNPDGSLNLNHYNIVVEPFIKGVNDREFKPYLFPCAVNPCELNFNGRFPRLLFDDREEPLIANITYNIPSSNFPQDSVMKFNIYIKDRQLNNSNIVTVDSLYIPLFQ